MSVVETESSGRHNRSDAKILKRECDAGLKVILGFVVGILVKLGKNGDLGLDMITDRNSDLSFTA